MGGPELLETEVVLACAVGCHETEFMSNRRRRGASWGIRDTFRGTPFRELSYIHGVEVIMRRRVLLLAPAFLLLAGCDFEDLGSSDRYTADFHYSYPLKSGGRLSVENFNGSIEIASWDQDSVDISGVKYAGTPELRDAIKIDIVNTADSVHVRTVRPSERRGNMGAKYVIKVPRKTELERITSSNGGIRVSDVEGPARLRSSNG